MCQQPFPDTLSIQTEKMMLDDFAGRLFFYQQTCEQPVIFMSPGIHMTMGNSRGSYCAKISICRLRFTLEDSGVIIDNKQ
jgi:hypothetical protein